MPTPIHQRFDNFRHQKRTRAGSLIISVFGDVVVPRGSRIWLGSLISLLKPLALTERLVRTSVFRLAKEDWLRAVPSGRRSDYLLTPLGQRRAEAASRRIYASSAPPWDQRWRLIIAAGDLTAHQREDLRRLLAWQGFGTLSGGCFVHPGADLSSTFDILIAEGLGDALARLKPLLAADAQLGGAASDIDLVRAAWNLEQLSALYLDFVECYQPALAQLRGGQSEIDDESAFLLRVLVIHDYRRLLLRDPDLPDVLLTPDWPGKKARLLCKELYRRLLVPSERHLDGCFQLADGDAPKASVSLLANRFRESDPLGQVA
ncbi:MAG: phenylacetic acid degradation operon negative regulatory protein PaaX [Zoogloeaceae bacterium]|nr:phenylacetic acid degradation operon negative regulatory protein PaaX [Zoogloeaceae bacterium]